MHTIKLSIFCCLFTIQTAFAQLDFSKVNSSTNSYLSSLDSTILSGKYEQITSVLIAQKGEVIFEKYYNGTNESSTHNTRSATKTMATLLTGVAIKQGYIKSEQDKIFQYLEHKLPVENPDERKEAITIEDLLTMSACLECNDFNNYSRGHEERMYLIEDWTSFYLDLPIRAYTFEPQPEEQSYGRSFSYCSAGAATMAEVLQVAVGMDLDEFAQQQLFQPLGIEDYQLDYNPEGILNTAGGSNYTSRDFLKMIQLCLNGGSWEGKQLIDSVWLEKATTPKAQVFEGMNYGYFFWLKSFGKDTLYAAYAMSGNGGQKILAVPELELSVVITTANYGNRNAHNYTDEMMNEFIIPAMLD